MTRIDPRIYLKPIVFKFDPKVQKEVSQMANHNLLIDMLLGGLSLNLNYLKIGINLIGTPTKTLS